MKMVKSVCSWVRHNRHSVAVVVVTVGSSLCASAQSTDAVSIATTVSTDFAIIAPITITVATFYVILKLAKRTVK